MLQRDLASILLQKEIEQNLFLFIIFWKGSGKQRTSMSCTNQFSAQKCITFFKKIYVSTDSFDRCLKIKHITFWRAVIGKKKLLFKNCLYSKGNVKIDERYLARYEKKMHTPIYFGQYFS